MFILNKKTNVIQECSNNDVIKACKKDANGYAVADTMAALRESNAAEAAQAAAKEAEAAQAAAKAAEEERAALEAKEAAEKAAAEQQKVEDEKKVAEAAQAAQGTAQETNAEDVKGSNAVDYQSMNVADLRKVAKEKGIQGYGNMNKDTLVAVIMAH